MTYFNMILSFFFCHFLLLHGEFFVSNAESVKALHASKDSLEYSFNCIKESRPEEPECVIRSKVPEFQGMTTCVGINSLRVIGDFKKISLICSAPYPIDFYYDGVQPTEAINISYWKGVTLGPGSEIKIDSFNVQVDIFSNSALLEYFQQSRAEKVTPRYYSRTGNYTIHGIFNETMAYGRSFYLFLEDMEITPTLIKNEFVQPYTIKDNLFVPCRSTHFDFNVTMTVQPNDFNFGYDPTYGFVILNVEASSIAKRGIILNCTLRAWNGTILDTMSMTFPRTEEERYFGLEDLRPTDEITFDWTAKVDNDTNVFVWPSCSVDEWKNAKASLIGIEATNYAQLRVLKEFAIPKFANQSYTVHFGDVSTEVLYGLRIAKPFHGRGGVVYCTNGKDEKITDYTATLQGKIYPLKYKTNYLLGQRRTSEIKIHYDLKTLNVNSKKLFAGDNVTFWCKLHFTVVPPAIWLMEWKNESISKVKVDYDWNGDISTYSVELSTDMKTVFCSSTFWYADFWRNISSDLDVNDGISPTIKDTNQSLSFHLKSSQFLSCEAEGQPKPMLSIERPGIGIIKSASSASSLILPFLQVTEEDVGDYICRASNVYGEDVKIFTVTLDESNEGYFNPVSFGIPISLLILALIVVILGVVYYMKSLKNKVNLLTKAEVAEFMDGLELMRQEGEYAHDFAVNHPYDQNYEVHDDQFEIDRTSILGSGNYGTVFKCLVNGKMAAVKTVNRNADKMYLKALLSELKVMLYMGHHEHIVHVIGACTKNVTKGDLFIFVELCELGSLQSYLQQNREHYVDAGYVNSAPEKIGQSCMTYFNLVSWMLQMCKGMEFLSERKVIHGDLAARNILLTSTKDVKITDFGLSRQLYNYSDYVKKHQEPLPWRWLALESLRDLTFSSQSDVWSFGVACWEIFSLGEVPYPGFSWSLEFIQELEKGLRMPIPKQANETIYNKIILPCWNDVPLHRPTFKELRSLIETSHN